VGLGKGALDLLRDLLRDFGWLSRALTWSATAYAECAWVLWVEKITPSESGAGSREWIIQAARPSRNECASDLKRDINAVNGKDIGGVYWKRLGTLDAIEFRQRGADGVDQVIHTTRYVCVPDTLDPRGPKGK
jgi:hypothetical protein